MDCLIICEGKVQGVGFRARTKFLAGRLGIEGLVRNTSDGKVEIFARAKEKRVLDEFKSELGKTFSLGHLPVGKAEKITVHEEGSAGFIPAWKHLRGFEIDYGE